MSHDVSYLKDLFPDHPVVYRTTKQVPTNGIAVVIHAGKYRMVNVENNNIEVLASANNLGDLRNQVVRRSK
jgi:hypothetical protein